MMALANLGSSHFITIIVIIAGNDPSPRRPIGIGNIDARNTSNWARITNVTTIGIQRNSPLFPKPDETAETV